jgi:type II secretory pathway predicted ATPase ExeA
MDASFFGLQHRPFPATPDTNCYYPATSHERALALLLGGLHDGEGILVLTGAPGTGKTLLCHCLLERRGSDTANICLTNSHVRDRAGLLQALLFDLSLPYEGRAEQEMRLALTDHLLRTFGGGQSTVLLIDEAHHLTPDVLEELRLLGNLEGRSGKAVQVVLVGQPDLLNVLRSPELAALWQRLAVRVELQPLDVQESADYLLHHLRVAGGRPEEVITPEVLEPLARATGGVPRLLNQAASGALSLAAEAGAPHVDLEAVLEALARLDLEVPEEPPGGGDEEPLLPPVLSMDGAADLVGLQGEDAERRLFVSPRQPA